MSSRWRCVYEAVLMHRCVQGGTLYMCDQFGVGGTMSVGVIRTSCFMAKHRNCLHSHAQQEEVIKKLLITCHLQCLKLTLCEFEVDGMKSLGLVRSNMRPGNDQNTHQN